MQSNSLKVEVTTGADVVLLGEATDEDSDTKNNISHDHTAEELESSSSQAEGEAEDDDDKQDDETARKRDCYIRTAVGLFLLGFIVFVISDSLTNQYIKTGIESFLEWMEENPVEGFFAFVLVNFFTTMLFIPGILLTVGAGFVFTDAFGLGVGVLLGTLASFLGAFTGAVASFLIGRFMLRQCVSGLAKKFTLLEALDNAFEDKGFRIMALLRLSPLIYASPYLNYGMGGSALKFWDFTLSMFAILPGTVLFVFLGASAGSLADGGNEDSPVTVIVTVLGIVFSVIAVAATSYYAKKELDKVAEANRQETTGQEEDDQVGDTEAQAAAEDNVDDGNDESPTDNVHL